jgi:adenine phosphoribosyltransferase
MARASPPRVDVVAAVGLDGLKAKIRDVPDWPEQGVVFKDIMPLLADRDALKETVDLLGGWAEERQPDIVVGGEARGFFIGSAIAYKLGCGFVPARRPGKLPLETISVEYALEYGKNALELQADAFEGGTRVLIHDDVLATGGTSTAMAELVEQLGGQVVGLNFIIELDFLKGREKIADYDVFSLIHY